MGSSSELMRSPQRNAVKQFSIFADNKVGRLNDIVMMLSSHDIHIMALATVDTTDSSILRLIVDYWEQARELFRQQNFSFCLNEVIVAEIGTEQDLKKITCSMVQTEINIHYTYPMLVRPGGQYALVMRLEDNDMATDVLNQNGIKTLTHYDIAR